MSEVTAPAVVGTTPGPPGTPPPPADPMRRMRRFGYCVLGLQLAGFWIWSAILYAHYAVTWDFATYNQPWFLVAHGNLDPFSTIAGIPFWRSDSEFMPWLLAPLYWIFRSGLTLLWVQDISIVGAEAIAFTWICRLAARQCRERDAIVIASLGLLLLVANPWTWWTVSFDVHEEPLIIVFVALLAWDLAHNRRRAWVWMVLVLLGGAPSATYVIGIGLGSMLVRRRIRTTGFAMVLIAVAYSLLIVVIHGDVGVPLPRHYGTLATANGSLPPHMTFSELVTGIASHPQNIVTALWSKRLDMIAAVGPGGLLGLAAPLFMPLFLVALLANTLSNGVLFIEPSFQSVLFYVLLPVGTVAVLVWILRRRRRLALVLTGLAAVQALGWTAVWAPQISAAWLRTPGSSASTLASIAARIPQADEVIASQGVVGRFSSRALVYGLFGAGTFALRTRTWVVLAPQVGVETLSPAVTKAMVGELAGPLHATLVTHANGIWAFVLSPSPSITSVSVPGSLSPLPAWTSAGIAGSAVLTGPEQTWHVVSTGAAGYVADQLEWQAPAARYLASVTLATSGPVNVEVWNDTGNTLLARQTIAPTDGVRTITLPVNAAIAYQTGIYSGWGPFRAQFFPPPPGERIEVRVWSPGSTFVSVYSADLNPVVSGGAGGRPPA